MSDSTIFDVALDLDLLLADLFADRFVRNFGVLAKTDPLVSRASWSLTAAPVARC